MSTRPAKWHIYGPDNQPLTWDDKALEFDSQFDARCFLLTAMENSLWSEDFWVEVEIRKDSLSYDGGHMDATKLRVGWNPNDCDEYLYEIQ